MTTTFIGARLPPAVVASIGDLVERVHESLGQEVHLPRPSLPPHLILIDPFKASGYKHAENVQKSVQATTAFWDSFNFHIAGTVSFRSDGRLYLDVASAKPNQFTLFAQKFLKELEGSPSASYTAPGIMLTDPVPERTSRAYVLERFQSGLAGSALLSEEFAFSHACIFRKAGNEWDCDCYGLYRMPASKAAAAA